MPRYEEEGKQDTQARFKITDVALDNEPLAPQVVENKKNFPSCDESIFRAILNDNG